MRWLVLLLMSATVATAQPKPPALLEQALRRLPGVSILNPPVDLPGEYTIDQLKGFGYWPPWVLADLDRDGRADVVATVVKHGAGKTQFGVMAVHAQTPMTIHWVVEFQAHSLYGVAVGGNSRGRDTVTPLVCLQCDSNSWFRWSGNSYEHELYAIGETLAIATYPERQKIALFEQPRLASKPVGSVKECTEAKVLDVRGTRETRWYLVEVRLPRIIRGWMPASFSIGGACIG